MDCCGTKNQNYGEVKGGKFRMERRIVLWVVIGFLFLAALFLIFKAGSGGSIETAKAAGLAVKSAASSSAGMVGGC